MIQALVVLFAFTSASLLVVGVLSWLRTLLVRHPEARLAFDGSRGQASWVDRVWELAIRVAAEELPDSVFDRIRRRIALDLRRAGESAGAAVGDNVSKGPDRFLARAVLEGAAIALTLAAVFFATTGGTMFLLTLGIGALHAFGIRPQMLRARAAERVGNISRRLPYAVDLAALVLGAGGTPREALELVARQPEDPLAEEFGLALAEMRSGTSQSKALRAMADRLRMDDVSSLVVAINRGEATGAPMAKALETQAEVFRFRRLQRAERLAVEAPVKMMFPNMLIMLSVLLLVLGPVIVQLIHEGLL